MKNRLLNSLNNRLVLFLTIFIFSVVIRLYYLGYESINPDAVNWHYRCQQFANGIKYLQFEKTYPHYHPGVTLCYTMAVPTEIYKQITGQIYNSNTYLNFNFVNSLSLILVVSFLISLIALQFSFREGVLFSLILNLEPFFFGNSKLIHLDTLLSLCIFLSLIFIKNYLSSNAKKDLIYSGLFLALGFLTKSVAIVFFPFSLIGIYFLSKSSKLKNVGIYLASFILTAFILFPALWVAPVQTITRIFKEADRVGVRTGHSEFFLGEFYDDTSDPGLLFYPVDALIKYSPLIIFGIFLITISIFKFIQNNFSLKKFLNFEVFLLLIYFVYLFVIFYSDKKVDRYLLVLLPPIFYFLAHNFGKHTKTIIALLVVNFISMVYFSPFQFLYFSPVFMNYTNVNNLVGQKSFGMGMYDLREYLKGKYGEKSLGFYDIKPMETIYPNSKVHDIRESSQSKVDIVILSVNEVLPEKYNQFSKKESFIIKGIPLYDIYTRN
jgi:hypothetical protein